MAILDFYFFIKFKKLWRLNHSFIFDTTLKPFSTILKYHSILSRLKSMRSKRMDFFITLIPYAQRLFRKAYHSATVQ